MMETTLKSTRENESKTSNGREYTTPQLKIHGDVFELTADIGRVASDGQTGDDISIIIDA